MLDGGLELQLYASEKLGWCLLAVPAAAALVVEVFSQAEEGCWERGLLPAQSSLAPAGEESCGLDSNIRRPRDSYDPCPESIMAARARVMIPSFIPMDTKTPNPKSAPSVRNLETSFRIFSDDWHNGTSSRVGQFLPTVGTEGILKPQPYRFSCHNIRTNEFLSRT